MYIDTHAHLNYEEKYGDEATLLAHICAAGVEKIIDVGWNYASSAYAAKQAQANSCLWFAAGYHPSNLEDFREGDFEKIAALLTAPKGVAVGEIGLDYHYENTDEDAQNARFVPSWNLRMPFVFPSSSTAATPRQIPCKSSKTIADIWVAAESCIAFRAAKRRRKNI